MMLLKAHLRRPRGVTLLELVIVLVVLSILIAIAIPGYRSYAIRMNRSDARRDGSIVGVIKPSERAMLGTGRSGWRQVRMLNTEGWVDPRHFAPDSSGSRG